MATKILINTVRVGTYIRYAGQRYDTTNEAADIAAIEAAGGVLLDSDAILAEAADKAITLRQTGDSAGAASLMAAAATKTTNVAAGAAVVAVVAGNGILVAGSATEPSVAVSYGLVGDIASVASAAAAGTSPKVSRADHAHAHGAQLIGDGSNHASATQSIAGFMGAVDKTKLDGIQAVVGSLTLGELTISSGIVVVAGTRVVGIVPVARGGTFPAGGFEALAADNVVGGAGVGSVKVTARKADGTLETGCTDTVAVLLATAV